MKISAFEVFVVGTPPPHFGGRYWVFVKLTTDGGVEGIGEVYSLPFHPRAVERMVAEVCERSVVGADPFRIESLWRRIYSSGYSQRPDPSLLGVLSAVEMACWDIIGKELGRPVYDLLGGKVHERLRSYTYLYPAPGEDERVYRDPDLAAQRASEYLAAGFTAVKFDPAGPYSAFDPRQLSLAALDRCELFMKRLREAVGSSCDLLFGTHGQMTPAGAIRLARRLEPYDPLWFEEPTPPEMPGAMGQVARHGGNPLRADRTAPLLRAGRRRGEHSDQHLQPELPDPGIDPDLGRLPCRAPQAPDPLGGGLRPAAGRTRSRRGVGRGGCPRPSL